MSAGENISATPESPDDPFNGAIKLLDITRENFFNASLAYLEKPSRDNLETIALTIGETAGQLEKTADLVVRDEASDPQQKADVLTTLIIDEDNQRVSFFKAHAPGKYKKIDDNRQDVSDNLRDLIELIEHRDYSPELLDQFVAGYMANYTSALQLDLDVFTTSAGKTRKNQLRRFGRVAAAHSLDVAKIAVGSAVAAWVVTKKLQAD